MKSLPIIVQKTVQDILQVLDSEYGESRVMYKDYGGDVILVENKEDFDVIKDKTYIDCDNVIAEYADEIVCSNGEVYTESLILRNTDYDVSRIIPLEITPQNLKSYIID